MCEGESRCRARPLQAVTVISRTLPTSQTARWSQSFRISATLWTSTASWLTCGLPRGVSATGPTCCKRCGFHPQGGKIPWRRAWQSTPGFSPGESHGQRSLVGYSPWGRKESDKDLATKPVVQSLHCISVGHPFCGIITIQATAITQLRIKGSQLHNVG